MVNGLAIQNAKYSCQRHRACPDEIMVEKIRARVDRRPVVIDEKTPAVVVFKSPPFKAAARVSLPGSFKMNRLSFFCCCRSMTTFLQVLLLKNCCQNEEKTIFLSMSKLKRSKFKRSKLNNLVFHVKTNWKIGAKYNLMFLYG